MSDHSRRSSCRYSIDLPMPELEMESPSAETLLSALESSKSSSPPYKSSPCQHQQKHNNNQQYPNWQMPNVPLQTNEIRRIFRRYGHKFGFQEDNVENMFDHLMTMLDSRSARTTPRRALWSLHADYIGGEHANYRKWYFAAELGLEDVDANVVEPSSPTGLLVEEAKREWRERMENMTDRTRVQQLALFLLIWGEAATLRYTPELLCFIFKLANDARQQAHQHQNQPPGFFLDRIVTPLYDYARNQTYQLVKGQCVRREKDHNSIVGYDDMNQLFWDRQAIGRLTLHDGTLLRDIPCHERYAGLAHVDWDNAFGKTFYESRSWLHVLTNFARIWIIHAAVFWYYMAANADFLYLSAADATHELPVKLSVIGLGGLVAVTIMAAATIAEFMYLPTTSHTSRILLSRLVVLLLLAAAHVGASVYVLWINRTGLIALIVGAVQLGLGAIVTCVLALIPSARLFKSSSRQLTCKTFTASFPQMTKGDRSLSILMWLCIFVCKCLEAYFFLALSFRDALAAASTMELRDSACQGDKLLGRYMCTAMPTIASVLMVLVELVLFFLDTYLWYVVWSTLFSVSQAFRMGISVMSSWRTLFSRLPTHMYQKVVHQHPALTTGVACAQMWNAIIIAMYREHLLSSQNLQSLLYHWRPAEKDGDGDDSISSNSTNVDKDQDGYGARGEITLPPFFDPDQKVKKEDCFPVHSEAERRLSFFAQSLSTEFPLPCSVKEMPTFTVFTPHYAEKMILTLREIIREEDDTTRVTLLEYLKRLHPTEWDNFVKDTKFLAEEEEYGNLSHEHLYCHSSTEKLMDDVLDDKDDLPFYCIGFKSSKPEYTMRTRMWASLRAQTLYRTVSGFMNYARALKILYRIEHPEMTIDDSDIKPTEERLDAVAHQKFRYLVAMQRYSKFTPEEADNCETILREYPNMQIAYIDEEPSEVPGEPPTFYSALIDGYCPRIPGSSYRRQPRYRIRLPGNPILGDGKSDNQNHAIIFYRGEYLQLVDANQDNYLEECLKIRNIFGEFEQSTIPHEKDIYALHHNNKHHRQQRQQKSETTEKDDDDDDDVLTRDEQQCQQDQAPVAIVGAREYIFSENVGVLGDVAAGKEQTFGTLTQRIMTKAGGRLHYGHPDFLNAVFMTTRGGVSKAQRGLHLNEDIYAGMNALSRGGRIKHTEYLQCGKGRDLGFCSILNFTTKIGTGMGEQMLSREYYYLGTQLPMDRFLTFYYAHPGFHMNNIMIMFAVQLFLFCMTFVGTMASSLPVCRTYSSSHVDCFNVTPVYDWLQRCITAIFWVFFIAFLPLFLQELTEKGTWRSSLRLFKQFLSLSPLFEVFVNQIYANSVLSNLSFGGARYIATGRGFATSRLPFSVLYSRFANPSVYFGSRTMFMLGFVTLTIWMPHLLYFWFTVGSLVVSPFVFNPHQFVLSEFIVDYREFLGWLSRGNGARSYAHAWITFCRQTRTRFTGTKRRHSGQPNHHHSPRAQLSSIFASEIGMPLVQALLCLSCFVFYKSRQHFHDQDSPMGFGGAIARIAYLTAGPIVWNSIMLLLMQLVSLVLAATTHSKRIGLYTAGAAHGLALLGFVIFFELFWWIEAYEVRSTVLGLLAMFACERFIFKAFIALFLPRELQNDVTNRIWWTGQWCGSKVGLHGAREYICKIVEMSAFTTDFILGHLILFVLFPFTLVPRVDRIHSLMLFWLRPSKQIRPSVLSTRQRQRRRQIALVYGPIFCLVFLFFLSLVTVPPYFMTYHSIKSPAI